MLNKELYLFNSIVKTIKNKDLRNLILQNEDNTYFKLILKKYGRYKFKSILKCLKIKYFNKEEVLFYENSQADDFFIILNGKIDIYKNKQNIRNLNEFFKQDKNEIKNYWENKYSKQFLDKYKDDPQLFSKEKSNFKVKKLVTLKEGDIFGELGLLNHCKRKATALINNNFEIINKGNNDSNDSSNICLNNFENITILASLKKNYFFEISDKIELKVKNKKFFSEFFKNYGNNEEINNIINYFKKIKIDKNVKLINKSDKIHYLYLIKKGTVSILDNMNPYDSLIKNENSINLLKNNHYKNIKFVRWDLKVREVTSYYFIGLTEFFEKRKNYIFNYKALTNCCLYKIDAKV